MPPPASPTVASWELVHRLRERRQEAGVEVRTITQALGFSRNYWSAVENGRAILSEEKLTRLLELLEFDHDEQQELLELRETARQRGWWTRYSGLFGTEQLRLYGLEYGAQSIRAYESLLIPGLLQTADYAKALISDNVTVPKVEVDQRVEVRMRRQERLVGEDPLEFTAVISQAALLQEIGGSAVLRSQLRHVANMIEQHPNTIEVRVIPFTAKACGLFGVGTFHLLDFMSSRLRTLAWHETVTVQNIIDDPTQVRDLLTSYNDALERTVSAEDSLRLIRQRVRELA
ncbi:MAG TPA: helix-turn-helix transcriptional regulator [Actinophytocola sp.]|uniref:helix-turn-helix domain-containing protein n=1 Tax=Actinophytocola sp. TaxID=1872138 RepID=UPI002DDCDBFF|nr:helix-turn-helix transcriptional regulator [Actinophytocola sp.]HEV2780038.1 helix-turn-helix transcriptional regulator [Actinophytocola sp.]